LVELAKELALSPEQKPRGLIVGYFAQHIYFTHSAYFRFGGRENPVTITCEIQLGTTLAKVIWESGHRIYEQSRDQPDRPADWQWNPKDPRFLIRQLGHMIHLADGILVNLRDVRHEEKEGPPQ